MKDFRCVVRVQEEAYLRGNTYFYGKSLRVVKRLTTFNIIAEEAQNVGMDEAMRNILNVFDVDNGLYEIVVTNQSYDIESGYLDDWSWKLIPYEESQNE